MSIKDVLIKMYPADKANHFMRGTFVAAMVASAAIIVVSACVVYALRIPDRVSMPWSMLRMVAAILALAAVVGQVAAYAAGRWKELRDQKANEAMIVRGQPPIHGVETADWQFTAWGGAPVTAVLLVAAGAVAVVGSV